MPVLENENQKTKEITSGLVYDVKFHGFDEISHLQIVAVEMITCKQNIN